MERSGKADPSVDAVVRVFSVASCITVSVFITINSATADGSRCVSIFVSVKLRHVSFHSLRHTNASIRIHAGQNIKYMSSQLGHASVKITLDTYGHLFNDQDFNRRQVDMLETTFNASVRNPLENPLLNAEKELAVSANSL